MNKRIEELARQAGYKHDYAVGNCEDYAYFSLTYFAELIIADCGAIADKFMDEHLAICPSTEIKKYFGVKE